MDICCVPGCDVESFGLQRIPYHDEELTKAWLEFISDPELHLSNCISNKCRYHGVCEQHFEESDSDDDCMSYPSSTVPTLNPPPRDTLVQYNMNNVLKDKIISPGAPSVVTIHLDYVSKNLSEMDKYCILIFDEICLRPKLYYNLEHDFVEGFADTGDKRYSYFANRALVVMACGITRNWRLPITYVYFNDEQGYSKDECLQACATCWESGLKVVAAVGAESMANIAVIESFISTNADVKYKPHFSVPDKYNEGSFIAGATIREKIPFRETPEELMRNFDREPIKQFFQKIYDSCHKNTYPDCRQFMSSYRNLCIEMLTDMVGKTCEGFCSKKALIRFDQLYTTLYMVDDAERTGEHCPITGDGDFRPQPFTLYAQDDFADYIAQKIRRWNDDCEECEEVFKYKKQHFKAKPDKMLVVPRKIYATNSFAEYISFFYNVITLEIPRFISGLRFTETVANVTFDYCSSSKVKLNTIECSDHDKLLDEIIDHIIDYKSDEYIESINKCFEGEGKDWEHADDLERNALRMHYDAETEKMF